MTFRYLFTYSTFVIDKQAQQLKQYCWYLCLSSMTCYLYECIIIFFIICITVVPGAPSWEHHGLEPTLLSQRPYSWSRHKRSWKRKRNKVTCLKPAFYPSLPPHMHGHTFFLKRWKRAYREIYCTSKESKFVLQWVNRERIKIVRNILQHTDIVEGSLKLCRSKRKRTIMAKTF